MTQAHPAITGNWTPADESTNTLEVAPTEQQEVFAIRDSYDQREVIFATRKQLSHLVDAVQKGRMRNILMTGGR